MHNWKNAGCECWLNVLVNSAVSVSAPTSSLRLRNLPAQVDCHVDAVD